MTLLAIVISGFVLAIAAPWVTRATGKSAGWILAALPAAIAGYLISQVSGVASGQTVSVAYQWIPGLGIDLSFMLDGLSLLFALMISGIGALILIYAGGYLAGHPHQGRLFCFLLLFMGSMLGVVLAANVLTLFVFWELTSITSYLLIGFDHRRKEARAAALQALLVTGLGGLAMLAGLLLMGHVAGSYSISEILSRRDVLQSHALAPAITILVLVGCFTKSAQFPFHFWLPGAMEAPTPISAYLHSSTMVKAGIYLMARLTPALGSTELWQWLLTGAGAATMLAGALLAMREAYLKRLLAYSTVSALGIITMGLGIGTEKAISAAIAFILAHALYKGSLFMVAGAIDHETGEKNVDKLSGLRRAMPILSIVALLAAASQAGFPPLAGFVAKEMMLESAQHAPIIAVVLTAALTLSAALLVVVAGLVAFKPFFGGERPTPKHAHEPPLSLLLGPGLLAILGVAVALVPGMLADPLIAPAASATLGSESHTHFKIWHGFNLALGLSAIATGVGVLVYATRSRWMPLAGATSGLDRLSPTACYHGALRFVTAFAESQTRMIQTGRLRDYLIVIFLVTIGVVSYPLLTRVGPPVWNELGTLHWLDVGIAVLILLSAFAAVTAKNRLLAIIALGMAGLGVTMFYVIYAAPDLALTQISIEALSVVLFVLVFRRLPDFRSLSSRAGKLRDVLIACAGGAMMAGLVLMATSYPSATSVSRDLAERSYPEGHGKNVVNVILVDFRAMDTMGEITVLAIAALGVLALLKLRDRIDDEHPTAAPDAGGSA
ncbi:MAG: putative monovalent cation/H+ antiporter subunit A [Phycisphaeraceae bacterium]|nr:putative monovalent cation/H+ antiporter subunit A [Phycisphaeraceae bacterium]MBX3368159.1 putative monovalent cation/H+ antiporter subunit A [Phycisphaeraceae bacterium]